MDQQGCFDLFDLVQISHDLYSTLTSNKPQQHLCRAVKIGFLLHSAVSKKTLTMIYLFSNRNILRNTQRIFMIVDSYESQEARVSLIIFSDFYNFCSSRNNMCK